MNQTLKPYQLNPKPQPCQLNPKPQPYQLNPNPKPYQLNPKPQPQTRTLLTLVNQSLHPNLTKKIWQKKKKKDAFSALARSAATTRYISCTSLSINPIFDTALPHTSAPTPPSFPPSSLVLPGVLGTGRGLGIGGAAGFVAPSLTLCLLCTCCLHRCGQGVGHRGRRRRRRRRKVGW